MLWGHLHPVFGFGWKGSGEEEVGGDRVVSLPGVDSLKGVEGMHDVEEKMCNTVNISIGYSAVLGAKLFAKVEMTNNCLQRLDQQLSPEAWPTTVSRGLTKTKSRILERFFLILFLTYLNANESFENRLQTFRHQSTSSPSSQRVSVMT